MNIIPLIDLFDNDFLVYNISEDRFQKINLSEKLTWKNVDSIQNYIDEILLQKKEKITKEEFDKMSEKD